MENNDVREIKDRLDIVELVGDYLKLRKVGAGYQALCPFHTEKTLSIDYQSLSVTSVLLCIYASIIAN